MVGLVLPADARQRVVPRGRLGAGLPEDAAEPVDTRADGVSGELPDLSVFRTGRDGQLLCRQAAHPVTESVRMLLPVGIHRCHGEGHGASIGRHPDWTRHVWLGWAPSSVSFGA